MNTLKEQLKEWKRQTRMIEQEKRQKKRQKGKKKEQLTRRDIEDLMGIRTRGYERGRGGAIRQK
ncbi:hypothetical protein [Ectobacillus ponti]|uniref:Phage protein n=1 Tax=Ectobacillus ponti TaxID=2961894 RepID=A0AA42BRM8_9BACI|nr:hypothetical protein [Ectobacillus ponti]MCP8970556.1 hypothetical protein [Ectobacillus ponti]